MNSFSVGGPVIAVGTTDISAVRAAEIAGQMRACRAGGDSAERKEK